MKTLIFTDPHYCTKESFNGSDRKPRLSLEKMKSLVKKAADDCVELIICLGDFINAESPALDRENLRVERDSVKEALKTTDQMEWVRQMNVIRIQAAKIVDADLILL